MSTKENRNIVILGASCGGLAAAHYICKHTLPKLQASKEHTYTLHLVDQSTHFWWHIAAPREICSVKEIKHQDAFVPIMDGFKQYPALKDKIVFHHGTVTGLDLESRTVGVRKAGEAGGEERLEYYALVLATGIRSPTPLTTLQGEHTVSQKALEDVNDKLKSAKEIVVSGGGPVGVETAGELGTHYGKQAKVTLVAGGKKLLPMLRQSLSDKAQRMLEKVGVKVLFDVKVNGSEDAADGRTNVKLSNGESILADVYIPGAGVKPNTEFFPDSIKKADGYINTNVSTHRVDSAGPRVYAVGDVAAVNTGGVLHLFGAIPVFGANMMHDLLTDAKLGDFKERTYVRKDQETQLVPIGAKMGVAAFNGMSMPGFFVSKFKGKDYMIGQMPGVTQGKKFTKA